MEKPTFTHVEEQLQTQKAYREDYSGAHAKTDTAEIKLVRKLDLFILPTLWIMVGPCQLRQLVIPRLSRDEC